MLAMNRLFHKLHMPLRVALLMLLLSMQGFTLAHELDQSTVHEGGVCAVCSIGGSHDGVIASHPDCPVQTADFLQSVISRESLPPAPTCYNPEARAPPCSH